MSAPEEGARDVLHRDRVVLVVVDLQEKLLPAIGALSKGYHVHVAADAVGARTPDNREVGLRRMERGRR